MAAYVRFIISVDGLVVFVLVTAIWIWIRPQSRLARRFLLAIAVLYAVASIYAVSFGLGRLLMAGFAPFNASQVPAGRTAIVVMGSGSYTLHDWSGQEYSTTDIMAASRVLEAVRVFKAIDAAWVVSSGGKLFPEQISEASAITMRQHLVTLGVPEARIVVQTKSRNTHEEAIDDTALLRTLGVDHVVAVTSGIHMRRTLGAFRAAGISAIPAIARDPFEARSWPEWLLPSDAGLWGTSALAHEVLGIGYYTARGWYRW